MNLALTIIHVVISLVLVVVVLMQHGKQQGLSGAIAGGAETFFGKNKGRTIDAMLRFSNSKRRRQAKTRHRVITMLKMQQPRTPIMPIMPMRIMRIHRISLLNKHLYN